MHPRSISSLLAAAVAAAVVVISSSASAARAQPGPEAGLEGGRPAHDPPLERIEDLPRRTRLALFSAQLEREDGDFTGAAQVLEEFVAEHADKFDNYLLRYHLANALVQANRPEDALPHYRRAMELEPRFGRGWLNMGELAYNLGRFDLAAEAILNGYELSSNKQPRLLYHAAAAHIMGESPEKAVPILEDLVSGAHGDAKQEWYRALVSAALRLDDTEIGAGAIEGLLSDFSDDPDAWLLAFQYRAANGEFEEAAVALAVTGHMRDLTRKEKVQLGNVYSAIEVPYLAGVQYEEAFGDSASVGEIEMLASAYLAAHMTHAALETLERAIVKEPTTRLWSLLGDLHYLERDYAASMKAFEHCIRIDADHSRSYLMMGYCALEMGDIAGAVGCFEKAAQFPDQEEKAAKLIARLRLMQRSDNPPAEHQDGESSEGVENGSNGAGRKGADLETRAGGDDANAPRGGVESPVDSGDAVR